MFINKYIKQESVASNIIGPFPKALVPTPTVHILIRCNTQETSTE